MARGLTGEKIKHGLSLTAQEFQRHHQWRQYINPKESTLLNNIPQPNSKIQFTQQSTSQNLLTSLSLKMQFITLLSAFVFAATAFAAPTPVADSDIEARAGAPSWEFHPFHDVSCQTPTGNILGGPQTPGSQCFNVYERIGGMVFSAKSTQGCKSNFPSPQTNLKWDF